MDSASPRLTDPCLLGAAELSRALAARRLSPIDVVDALLARIARLEPKLQAFVDVHGANARLAAEGAGKANPLRPRRRAAAWRADCAQRPDRSRGADHRRPLPEPAPAPLPPPPHPPQPPDPP